ncbi:MAG: spore maturation protein [Magnetospirillum sp.]|nr:spore maturation protein [Magnetospirillum sp.]
MNAAFLVLVLSAFATAAWKEFHGGGAMAALSEATLKAAEGAVPLALGLVGVMALFLGVMKVAEAAGLLKALARMLAPPLKRLFPEIPDGHPALGAMSMNIAANLLGLGNAATPFGIRAMEELEGVNPRKGVASNAQVVFLAINTAGVTLLPTKVIALRAALGAADPAAVVVPTLIATVTAAIVAVAAARGLQALAPAPLAGPGTEHAREIPSSRPPPVGLGTSLAVLAFPVALVGVAFHGGRSAGNWLIPGMIATLLLVGWLRGVRIYEAFVEGAREGFDIAVRIVPYLVAILVAVGMLRASGAMDILLGPPGRWLAPLGVPPEALMMAVVRSLSGSGAYGLLASALQNPATGPDSPTGILLGTIYGSTETTFYVLAVYFGAVGIRRARHALAVGLIADAAGLAAAVVACRLLYG